jgi:hypothetical protein
MDSTREGTADVPSKPDEMEEFMSFIKRAGFRGCPVCKNEEGFTWAHAAHIPGLGDAKITAFLPGTTTVPGQTRSESYPTPLYVLICDRCTHLMTFSKTMMLLKRAGIEK